MDLDDLDTESNPEEFRPVIDQHIRAAIDLMKATGEGLDPALWYELEPFIPPRHLWR